MHLITLLLMHFRHPAQGHGLAALITHLQSMNKCNFVGSQRTLTVASLEPQKTDRLREISMIVLVASLG